ncbi:MFS allantoate transporter-like protein [Aulographum hederae CBS 113979]|uniref:MFS allantoate transporter-like protein n=1 Tax=Aulographum hederae CBS 113979 TaxID=1176131 RepID=A0A6G1GY81_9PEZI|nr:MFS allantoate transporter-like protein [Aulographum hederae CBS 113979]
MSPTDPLPADVRKSDSPADSDVEKNPDLLTTVATGDGKNDATAALAATAPSKILEHSQDADAAMEAFRNHQGPVLELDEATRKRLLRRIDLHLMPILCIVYGLNYLDKTTLSYASVMGISRPQAEGGIGLINDNYNWLGSVFYFGYLAWEYPTSRLLQRFPLGKYSAFNVIMWGAILTCFAAVENFAGAVAIRFFLGVFESAVTPGFALFTSQWYTKREQGTRTGIWFCFNGFAQIFGGVVAYGIARGVDKYGSSIAPWKIIFMVTGLLTICMGIIFLFVVPDNQMNARWLSKEDRLLAIERIRENQQGVGNKHFKMYQLKEALADPLTWAFVFASLVADIPNGGISNFFSLLIRSFGYTAEESLLYGTPGGAVEIVALLLAGYLGDKYGNRILIGTSGMFVSIIGMILVVALPASKNGGRLAGYYLTQSSPTAFVALLSLISTNVAGYTKKTTVAALYLCAYCVGNIIGPQTFRNDNYVPAEITIIVCWGLVIFDMVFIWWYCRLQNTKKATFRAQPGYVKLENQEWLDLTDRENPEFVYTL